MATILFYEKPGCRMNARQKRMIEAAGHIVNAKSLLAKGADTVPETLDGFTALDLAATIECLALLRPARAAP